MGGDVQCPAGCGPMEYKKNRNLKIRAWDPLGSVFYLAGLILIVNYIEVGSGEYNPGTIFGILLFIPGLYFSSLVTTDLSCNTCTGVILESKSIDKKLKGDLLGLTENKAKYIRTALSSSTEDSEYDCPDCGEKMSSAKIPIEDDVPVTHGLLDSAAMKAAGIEHRQGSVLVPDAIEEWSTVSKIVELDGCKECDLIWFKKAKKEKLLSKDSTIILKSKTSLWDLTDE